MSTRSEGPHSGVLVLMLMTVSVAFGWILLPFFGAILWGVLLSVIFTPVHGALLRRIPRWRNVASIATVLLIAILVVIPLTMVAAALVHEVSGLVNRLQSGELDVRQSLLELRSALSLRYRKEHRFWSPQPPCKSSNNLLKHGVE
jgi:predicted PurR-regulated permease PerM